MRNLREQANRVRQLPLANVAKHLGGEQNPQDRQRWDFPNCAVWIGKGANSHRFYDHRNSQGGGGAIDFAIYVLGCTFKEAVDRLSVLASGSPASAVRPSAQPDAQARGPALFSPPKANPQHQGVVFDFLTNARGLPAYVIEPVTAAGEIYSDSRRNAVFVCRAPDGQVTGAELRGTGKTPYKGMAAGSRRGVGFFTISHSTPTELVVVESALDALAYHALFPTPAATVISTAGVLATCPAVVELAAKLGVSDIVIAYDSDDAGDRAAEELIASIKEVDLTVRRRAPWSKDWNDVLLQVGQVASHAETLAAGDCQPSLFAEVV